MHRVQQRGVLACRYCRRVHADRRGQPARPAHLPYGAARALQPFGAQAEQKVIFCTRISTCAADQVSSLTWPTPQPRPRGAPIASTNRTTRRSLCRRASLSATPATASSQEMQVIMDSSLGLWHCLQLQQTRTRWQT